MSETYFSLASGNLFQNWSNAGLITADDDWSAVPSIMGFRGDALTSGTGVNAGTVTGTSTVIDVTANLTNPNTFTTGGVAEFAIANPTVALQGSGTARAPYLSIYLDATGRQNVTLSFNARDIDGSADNAAQQIAVQYRIGPSGTWVNLPAGYIADASTGGSATQVTAVTVTLPPEANGQSQLQVRIITTDSVGSDEWIGIDDISVTSDAAVVNSGNLSINDVSIAEGNAGTSDLVFTVTRSGGSAGAVEATWTLASVNTDAADFAGPLSGTVQFADGQSSATITVSIAGDTAQEANETFTVTLSNPVGGATLVDASGTGTITNDDLGPIANVFVNEINYDPAGADSNEFVEIAGQAGTDLTGYKLVLYNGNGGASYATINLSGVLVDTANGFGFVKIPATGLQNGAPDGIALVDNGGRVIQFLSYEGTFVATNGPALGMLSTEIGVEQSNAALGFTLQLQGTGSSYGDFTWGPSVPNTEGAVNAGQTFLSGTDQGQVRIDDARVTEGNAGESMLTFTVHRAGGFASSATVDWQVNLDGSADAADLGVAAVLSGSVTFGVNEFVKTITVPVSGDLTGELNETLSVALSNAVGNVAIVDGVATGTIVNDDPIPLTIMQIQGAGHASEYVGQPVITSGIVTAVDAGGFFIQDPNGDGNSATSDGIFVFLGSAPSVAVGDAVTIGGAVSEFAATGRLSVTQINPTSIAVNSTGNALPTAVVIGSDGILPPNQTIDDDGLTVFDPANDGIDFWESLEGMRVTIQTPQVVQNTNEFGETDVVASLGVGATGMNDRGGITISEGDYNPEKIQLDDRFGALTGYTPDHSVGDQLGDVTGILNYSFGNYEVLVTSAVSVTSDVTLTDETSSLVGDANHLSIATYNLENLDPSDNKYVILASDIVYSLRAPDIVAVQEVQDADGAGNGGNLSGVSNMQGLIDAIHAASGISYTYVEVAPDVANSTGGEPGGNIRTGYLYRADHVSLVSGSLALITDPAFNGSRKPLVATWDFQGQQFTTINVHFTSRGGSDSLWGSTQPPANAGDAARTAQAGAVGNFVFDHLADNPALQFMILGDWNGFYFETAQTQLTDGGVLTNLSTLIDGAERYSYVFEGNSQLLDNMLATGGLLANAAYDAVHLNAQFSGAARPTDHDPQVALLRLGQAPIDLVISNATIDENQSADTVVGTLSATDNARDTLTYALTDDAGGRFAVDPVTGVVTATGTLNFEAGASYTIVARVTDTAGQTTSASLVIAVGDLNDAPIAVGNTIAVDEDATSANLWATLLGNDSDEDSDPLSIVSVNTTGTLGTVVFDSANQVLRYVADNDSFDALATGTVAPDSFTYTISDGRGGTSTATVTVGLTGIADSFRFSGGNGNDTITGTGGEDTILGGRGNDVLSGGAGHDWLQGDQGNDVLTGGTGRDSFVFGKSFGDDIVTDFNVMQDRLVLLDGALVSGTTLVDANFDGIADLRIGFSTGGSLTLLGVNSLAGVMVESFGPTTSGFAIHADLHM